MMPASRSLSRADRERADALVLFNDVVPEEVYEQQWELPAGQDHDLAVTWVYGGMLIAEETLGTAAGQFRHQYTIQLHAKRRSGFDRAEFLKRADTLAGALREKGFRAIFLPESEPGNRGNFQIGLLADRL